MEQTRRDRAVVLRQLRRMLRSRPNDTVKLALLEQLNREEIEGLDLTLLCEFKRSASGVVEVKLQDRLKLLEMLERLSAPAEQEGQTGVELFYQALEHRAEREEVHDS